jgi:hypothetical protein
LNHARQTRSGGCARASSEWRGGTTASQPNRERASDTCSKGTQSTRRSAMASCSSCDQTRTWKRMLRSVNWQGRTSGWPGAGGW